MQREEQRLIGYERMIFEEMALPPHVEPQEQILINTINRLIRTVNFAHIAKTLPIRQATANLAKEHHEGKEIDFAHVKQVVKNELNHANTLLLRTHLVNQFLDVTKDEHSIQQLSDNPKTQELLREFKNYGRFAHFSADELAFIAVLMDGAIIQIYDTYKEMQLDPSPTKTQIEEHIKSLIAARKEIYCCIQQHLRLLHQLKTSESVVPEKGAGSETQTQVKTELKDNLSESFEIVASDNKPQPKAANILTESVVFISGNEEEHTDILVDLAKQLEKDYAHAKKPLPAYIKAFLANHEKDQTILSPVTEPGQASTACFGYTLDVFKAYKIQVDASQSDLEVAVAPLRVPQEEGYFILLGQMAGSGSAYAGEFFSTVYLKCMEYLSPAQQSIAKNILQRYHETVDPITARYQPLSGESKGKNPANALAEEEAAVKDPRNEKIEEFIRHLENQIHACNSFFQGREIVRLDAQIVILRGIQNFLRKGDETAAATYAARTYAEFQDKFDKNVSQFLQQIYQDYYRNEFEKTTVNANLSIETILTDLEKIKHFREETIAGENITLETSYWGLGESNLSNPQLSEIPAQAPIPLSSTDFTLFPSSKAVERDQRDQDAVAPQVSKGKEPANLGVSDFTMIPREGQSEKIPIPASKPPLVVTRQEAIAAKIPAVEERKELEVNLLRYEKPQPQGDLQYTIGDMHANFLKLLKFVHILGGMEISKEDYERLVYLYQHFNLKNKDQIKNNLTEFRDILKRIKFSPEFFWRMLGDLTADRGKLDLYILYFLEAMALQGVRYEIIDSNHDLELKHYYEKNCTVTQFNTYPVTSLDATVYLVENGIISKEEFIQLVNYCYKPNVKLLSYIIREDGVPVIFNHAPALHLQLLAKQFNLPFRWDSPEEKKATLDAIIAKGRELTLQNKFYDTTQFGKIELENIRDIRPDDKYQNPLLAMLWGASYCKEAGVVYIQVHGHEGNGEVPEKYKNTKINLDHPLGKPGSACATKGTLTFHAHPYLPTPKPREFAVIDFEHAARISTAFEVDKRSKSFEAINRSMIDELRKKNIINIAIVLNKPNDDLNMYRSYLQDKDHSQFYNYINCRDMVEYLRKQGFTVDVITPFDTEPNKTYQNTYLPLLNAFEGKRQLSDVEITEKKEALNSLTDNNPVEIALKCFRSHYRGEQPSENKTVHVYSSRISSLQNLPRTPEKIDTHPVTQQDKSILTPLNISQAQLQSVQKLQQQGEQAFCYVTETGNDSKGKPNSKVVPRLTKLNITLEKLPQQQLARLGYMELSHLLNMTKDFPQVKAYLTMMIRKELLGFENKNFSQFCESISTLIESDPAMARQQILNLFRILKITDPQFEDKANPFDVSRNDIDLFSKYKKLGNIVNLERIAKNNLKEIANSVISEINDRIKEIEKHEKGHDKSHFLSKFILDLSEREHSCKGLFANYNKLLNIRLAALKRLDHHLTKLLANEESLGRSQHIYRDQGDEPSTLNLS